ncbi:MAG: hypothetical protein Q8O67_31840 [Deltaproteobacteria bacterium]|nr:hypothetical protein [Deltaproteobacteria bacterium]
MSEWFFTAPYDPTPVRRGDPLGFRTAASRYAEALAPGLSNRTVDARWFTLTAWTMVLANDVWRQLGHSVPAGLSRHATADLFSWMVPLELLQVARTLRLADKKGRQLPGQRAVAKWLAGGEKRARFGMSFAQFRRQRSSGVYGGYRVAFRTLPGLTVDGDGWRPDIIAEQLARVAQLGLGASAATPMRPRRTCDTFWQTEGWSEWAGSAGRNFLPEAIDALRPITQDEISLLRPLLFDGNDLDAGAERRSLTAHAMLASKATVHHELCQDLERKLSKKSGGALRRLGAFARLADAGLEVMNLIWLSLKQTEADRVPALAPAELTADQGIADALRALIDAAKGWMSAEPEYRPEWTVPSELAAVVVASARNKQGLIGAVVEHHVRRGGGRRWFHLDEADLVRPAFGLVDTEGSPYRFRLFSLARLAVQCGVAAGLPRALMADRGVGGGLLEEDQ